jgi:hypothetical protein
MSDEAIKTLEHAAELLASRKIVYGEASINFGRIADVASVILGRHITRYEVAVFLFATKVGRIQEDPCYADSYDDAINYIAFMKQFREDKK